MLYIAFYMCMEINKIKILHVSLKINDVLIKNIKITQSKSTQYKTIYVLCDESSKWKALKYDYVLHMQNVIALDKENEG